ncbi:hypothetical protein POMI540_3643 [Schizosaccharomyces pombe]|uniref:Uncharacterized bolA-like protein C4B3.11c n=1 Tax=Schizosaccharomyces pombe (strain 972 / ATCC 24843) TaxID=284812 RepID=YJ2B_SCHPO|nr:uncharacterized protein SPCC4B3.11c [Schizosaccharomyces pombe]Q9USK1.1 RecName: Full=Uncharacterized bolA-like protein C4B3.11c [Schizosaccharomyces pombe 972h-]CAB60685.1 mitochondrial conserved eukaryotic protein [Schizosaccharomyces pombe]|eukprot:NP_588079.1 uncharacterized protein SPCC4B3.11c [Schizosaccharomyces pombe]
MKLAIGRLLSPLFLKNPQKPLIITKRFYSTPGERRIKDILTEKLSPSSLRVIDVSGGCGSMYQVAIKSKAFQGKNTLAQHRLVNSILKEEIRNMHGLNLSTEVEDDISAGGSTTSS